jgi:MFS family permease
MLWILASFYVLVSPFLLAKALVAAPWDALGVWSLILLGTVALVGSLLAVLLGADPRLAIALACAAIGVAGLGLAPVSPIAAAGAIALALAAPFWAVVPARVYRGALFLVAALLGVWLLSEGALDARYRLVAAILLPAIVLLAAKAVPSTEYRVPSDDDRRRTTDDGRPTTDESSQPHQPTTDDSQLSTINYQLSAISSVLTTGLLVAVAVYPQAAVEWTLRPVVGAMAGGVAFPSALVTNWGLGLTVQAAQEQIVASLPATGIALAVFLAWVTLYWLRALARTTKDAGQGTKDEA